MYRAYVLRPPKSNNALAPLRPGGLYSMVPSKIKGHIRVLKIGSILRSMFVVERTMNLWESPLQQGMAMVGSSGVSIDVGRNAFA